MILCDECEPRFAAVCDFCKHYNFNGNADGAYTGDGWCRLHFRPEDPGSGCYDFHCKRADEHPAKEPKYPLGLPHCGRVRVP
jgi:hypothetical protein